MSNQTLSQNPALDALGQNQVQLGRFRASASVVNALRSAAQQSGVPFGTLLDNAAVESGLNPNAKASTSSASGLFQFIDQTWLAAVKRSGAAHGLGAQAAAIIQQGNHYTVADPGMRADILALRNNPTIAASLAADHLRDLNATLTASLGRAPDAAETYLAHFLGAGGATQMLKAAQINPDAPASSILPAAARANGALFNNQTVGQFLNKIHNRIDQTFSDLGLPVPRGGLQLASASSSPGAESDADPTLQEQPDGWGKGSPTTLSTAPARLMLASLAAVFTKLDQHYHHHGQGQSMPTGAVETLGRGAG
jgi:hypothetical protein